MFTTKLLARVVPRALRPRWRRTYAQEGEDIVLNALFGYRRHGIYVDIGAHDPVLWSNTMKLAELGWWGLNIDPRPGMHARFRRHRPRDICLEVAIDTGAGTSQSFWMFDDEPRWNCLAGEMPVNYRDGREFRPDRRIEVPVIGIEEALAQAALPHVDLLNLDIEGGEDFVLRAWPWHRLAPTAICVEIIGMPAAAIAGSALTAFLASRGMVFASQMISSVVYVERDFLARSYPRANSIWRTADAAMSVGDRPGMTVS